MQRVTGQTLHHLLGLRILDTHESFRNMHLPRSKHAKNGRFKPTSE